jgi:crotonobetainyl-CoA:carnitine CoA-transferase CaiB-like acyl-CoA transferase
MTFPGPLEDLNVVVAGLSRTTAMATWLLRNLGATVRPAIDMPIDPSLRPIINSQSDEWVSSTAANDVTIHHHEYCVGPCEINEAAVAAAVCEVSTRPTADGPRAPARGRELEAAVGLMWAAASFDGDRPVYPTQPFANYGAGLLVAIAVSAAVLLAAETGRPVRAEVDELHGALLSQAISLVFRDEPEEVLASLGSHPHQVLVPTMRCYQTSDGWVLMAAPSAEAWSRAAPALGRTDLLYDPRFAEAPWGISTTEARDALADEIADTIRAQSSSHWLAAFGEYKVSAAPVLDPARYLGLDHLRASGAVRSVKGRTAISLFRHRDAPAAGETTPRHHARTLSGLRVLELATYAAAPCVGRMLGDLGAEVTKVELPPAGDPYRAQGLAFAQLNRNKAVQLIDLATLAGRREFLEAVDIADVLITNIRPSGIARLDLGFETLARTNPTLIYCWVTAWGTGGPQEDEPGVDPLFQAVSGIVYDSAGNSGDIRMYSMGFVDMFAGALATAGVLAAVHRRNRTGLGQYVETPLASAALYALLPTILDPHGDRPVLGRDAVGPRALDRLYRTRDSWLYISTASPRGWSEVAAAVGIERPAEILYATSCDYRSDLATRLEEAFVKLPTDKWIAHLHGSTEVTCVRVPHKDDLLAQSKAGDGTLVSFLDPTWGTLWHLPSLVEFASPDSGAEAPQS